MKAARTGMRGGQFKVGDLCHTTGSKAPLLNNGLLVVIAGINHEIRSHDGQAVPYSIRRVDGQAFAYSTDRETGRINWCKAQQVWAASHHLRRIDDAPKVLETEHETEAEQPCAG